MKNRDDLVYWIGLVQADGHARLNKESKIRAIEFGNKNIRLVEKFCEVCENIFDVCPKINIRKNKIFYYSGIYAIQNKIKFLDGISLNDPPKPPPDAKSSQKLFGAYIAGVIDGDGDIRITSGQPQIELKKSIEDFLKCKVSITKRQIFRDEKVWKTWYALEFYVSSKNSQFIKKFILQYIISEHKAKRLKSFLSM